MNMGFRIRERLDELGWKQHHLLEKVPGLEAGTLSALIARDSKRSVWSEQIAEALGVRHAWLTRGDLPKERSVTTDLKAGHDIEGNAQPETIRPYPSGNRIPVVGSALLGDNGHFVELEYPVGHGDGWVDIASRDPNAYALRCRGDSMKPRIQSGEFVVVEPNTEPTPGDEVLVKAVDGRVMVKKYLYRRDGRVHLISVNEAHPSIAIEERDIAAMHYVGAIVKVSRWTTA